MAESNLVEKTSCNECDSSDANAVYDDGHTHCFSCGVTKKSNDSLPSQPTRRKALNLIQGDTISRTIRGITPATFKFWKYEEGTYDGGRVHIANHYKNGRPVAQKIRTADKDFKVFGKMDSLYGMWLWNKSQSKRIVITEGELDALSISQIQNNKWPVVSLPNGAAGAVKSVKNSIEFLESFEEIVLMFDMDEPGQDAALAVAQMFSPGKCKIANLPTDLKDANGMLVAGKSKELLSCMFNAEEYRPDGIVKLSDVITDILKPIKQGASWLWETLNTLTYGRRLGETYFIGAGTGVGKTAFIQECILHDINTLKIKTGVIPLEQTPVEAGRRLAGLIGNKKFHKPTDGTWDAKDLASAISEIEDDNLFIYDSRGSTDWDVIKQRIRYLSLGCDCKHIYLDNLTGLTSSEDEQERVFLERITGEIASLALELQIVIHVVSHLATPEGKSHEEGGRVMIRHFKGSRAIGFWAHFMIGLERNQQHEDEAQQNITTVRMLKDRYTGESTGKTFELEYLHDTGRLVEHDPIDSHPFGDTSQQESSQDQF